MPLRSHKPEWFYETLPWLYIGAGVLAILVIRNAMAVFGGIALIATGLLVWTMRRHYRRESPTEGVETIVIADNETHDFGYGTLVWRSAYECGDKVIDDQHRELFELANKLIDALVEGNPRSEVQMQLDNFVAHIVEHFETEEKLMPHAEDPATLAHMDIHHKLLARAKELNAKYRHGDRVVRDLVQFVANDVVAQHIILEDPKAIKAALKR